MRDEEEIVWQGRDLNQEGTTGVRRDGQAERDRADFARKSRHKDRPAATVVAASQPRRRVCRRNQPRRSDSTALVDWFAWARAAMPDWLRIE